MQAQFNILTIEWLVFPIEHSETLFRRFSLSRVFAGHQNDRRADGDV